MNYWLLLNFCKICKQIIRFERYIKHPFKKVKIFVGNRSIQFIPWIYEISGNVVYRLDFLIFQAIFKLHGQRKVTYVRNLSLLTICTKVSTTKEKIIF